VKTTSDNYEGNEEERGDVETISELDDGWFKNNNNLKIYLEDAAGAGELDQSIYGCDGGEGFTRAGRHLDERAGAVVGERELQILDGCDLGGPETLCFQGRQLTEPFEDGTRCQVLNFTIGDFVTSCGA